MVAGARQGLLNTDVCARSFEQFRVDAESGISPDVYPIEIGLQRVGARGAFYNERCPRWLASGDHFDQQAGRAFLDVRLVPGRSAYVGEAESAVDHQIVRDGVRLGDFKLPNERMTLTPGAELERE